MATFTTAALVIISVVCLLNLLLLAGVIFLVVNAARSGSASSAGRVRCPHCAEWIQPQAKVCRYCGREVTPTQPQ